MRLDSYDWSVNTKSKNMKLAFRNRVFGGVLLCVLTQCSAWAGELPKASHDGGMRSIGVARIDVSPGFPVRLAGYGNRREESAVISQPLWAKALAVEGESGEVFVMLTVDNCGLPYEMRDEILVALKGRGVTPESLAVSFSHTHSGPCVTGVIPNNFRVGMPPEHQRNVDRYTEALTRNLIAVATEAIDAMNPARLEWGQGKLRFATNRRERRGPLDHDFPIMVVRDPDDGIRAILATYACHATALGPDFDAVHGDWMGSAQVEIERSYPGAISLFSQGCAGENIPLRLRDLPDPVRWDEMQRLAEGVAAEVRQLIDAGLKPVTGPLRGRLTSIELPLQELPTRAGWEKKATSSNPSVAYHARKNLQRLDAGVELPTHIPYYMQCWEFGDDLAMLFMAGEVLADYSLGIKKRMDSDRIWVHGYSNDAPAYIPSRRSLALGGYEAVASSLLYDLPAPFSPEIEDMIFTAAVDIIGPEFSISTRENPLERATTAEEALAALHPRPGTEVQLAAGEPLVVDPISIAFGRDGRVWVVEMRDYPMGIDGDWKPGGAIRVLSNPDEKGRYQTAEVFIDGIPFPTGVMEWKDGILICAAPDLLYARDVDGDGRADEVDTLLTGFNTENFQSRLNGLSLGLDSWIYLGSGALGGVVYDPRKPDRKLDVRGYDLRFKPESREFERVSGRSKFGRVRDDWGNWFAATASVIATHYPYEYRYLKRNPHARLRGATHVLNGGARDELYPLSRPMERFNQPSHANHVTSACGLGIYRDDFLGEAFHHNIFTCEPVSSVVTRRRLLPEGALWESERVADEQHAEFLASTSTWFTPVEARMGPDGGLWVVDMVRPVIEHPRWIPPERLAKLNVRAGEDKGRLFRVVPKDLKLRPVEDLTALPLADLVAAMDTPNGIKRDLVHLELLFRADLSVVPGLEDLMRRSASPAVRGQALAVLVGLGAATAEHARRGMEDQNPNVQELALRLCDSMLAQASELDDLLPSLATAELDSLRVQLAFSLGEWHDRNSAAALLAQLAIENLDDAAMTTAVTSSATRCAEALLTEILASPAVGSQKGPLVSALIATAVATMDEVDGVIRAVAVMGEQEIEPWQFSAVAELQRSLGRRGITLRDYFANAAVDRTEVRQAMQNIYTKARDYVLGETATDARIRLAAIQLMGEGLNDFGENLSSLLDLIDARTESRFMIAVIDVLKRGKDPQIADQVVARWDNAPPSIRPRLLDLLISRSVWTETLMEALEHNHISAKTLPAEVRQRLLTHADGVIAKRAETLFAQGLSTDRMEVVKRYGEVAGMSGDALHGAEVFKTNCAVCHVFVGRGQSVGPALNDFRSKPVEDLLLAIFNPNAAIESSYTGYLLTLKDGSALAGVIKEESPGSFTLMMPGNVSQVVLRSDVAKIQALDTSFMPEGLEATLSLQDMADLFSYINEAEGAVGPGRN